MDGGGDRHETAFLEADLKEEVWIEIPDGYEFAFGEIDERATLCYC